MKEGHQLSYYMNKMEVLHKHNLNELIQYVDAFLMQFAENEIFLIEGLYYKSTYLLEKNQLKEAKRVALQALELCKKQKNDSGILKLYNHLAHILYSENHYKESAEVLNKALLKAGKIEDNKKENAIRSNLARIYNDLGQGKKAISLLRKVLHNFSKKKDVNYYYVLNNLIITCAKYNLCDDSKTLIEELHYGILKLDLDIQNSFLFLTTAKYLIEQGEIDVAEDIIHKVSGAIEFAGLSSKKHILDSTYVNFYFAKKLWDKAKFYIDEHFESAKKLASSELLLTSYDFYVTYYKNIHNFEKALLWKEKYFELYRENMNEERIKSVNEALQKFETERKEREAEIYRIKNVQMKKLNEELAQKNIKLEELNKELEKNLITKDKMYSVIAHDLRNPLGAIITCSDLVKSFLESSAIEDGKKFVQYIKDSADQVYAILESLLEWFKMKQNMGYVEPVLFSLNETIVQSIRLVELTSIQKKITIEFDNEKEYFVLADIEMIKVIIRNIISNAIKFSSEDSIITIAITEKDRVKLTISDQGMGIDENTIENILQANQVKSKRGTNNEKGTGLGLQIVKKFIKLNNGKMEIESKLGVGTSFHLYFPKVNKA